MIRQMFIVVIVMTIMLSSMIISSESPETIGSIGEYNIEKLTTNDAGDNVLARYAGDVNAPIKARVRTSAVQRSQVPQQHEWDSWTTISNIAENYKVKESYVFALTSGNAKLPKNQSVFKHDGRFSYSLRAWKIDYNLKDPEETINDCIAGSWIIAKKKCRFYPISKVADSFLPYDELNYPPAE